mmetsp:Transcript_57268/g.150720  ORF Transcript_57268/g.150720 Transcript_57268/m.150720 type:complete len:365 (+) Transcript_57268:1004-2098(+)
MLVHPLMVVRGGGRRRRQGVGAGALWDSDAVLPEQPLHQGGRAADRLELVVPLVEEKLQLLGGALEVDLHDVLDHLGALAEAQRADRLLLVEVGGRARDDERRLRVASQGLLQHAGELGVAVGHVRVLLVRQRVDDVAQGGQGPVDVLGLVEALARRARLRDLLTPRKVDKVELPHLHRAVVQILLLYRQHEDQVRPGGVLVHVRHGHGPVVVAGPHGVEDLLLAPDVRFRHFADEDASYLVLVDLEVVLLGVQQVADTLVVDLDDGDLDEELDVLVGMVDSVEDRPHHARDHALVDLVLDVGSLHRVRLAGGRLSVGEDGAVEAPQHGVDDRLRRVVVDLFLVCVPSKHPVEDEGVVGVRNVH